MTGRNSKPKNNGPKSSPSRIEQYGEHISEEEELIKFSAKLNEDAHEEKQS